MPGNKVRIHIKVTPKPGGFVNVTPTPSPGAKPWWKSWIKVLGLGLGVYIFFLFLINLPNQNQNFAFNQAPATSAPSNPAIANYAAGGQTVENTGPTTQGLPITETPTQIAMDINNQYANTPIACYLSPCLVHKMGSFDSEEIQGGQTVLGTTFQMSKNESEEDVWNFSVDTPANATFSFSTFVTLPNQNPNTWRTPDYSDAFGFQVLDKNNNVVYKSSPHEFQISVPLQTGSYRLTVEVDKSRIRNYAGESNAVNAYYWLNILGL